MPGRAAFRFELKGWAKVSFYKQRGKQELVRCNKTFKDLKGGGEGSRANFPRTHPPPPPPKCSPARGGQYHVHLLRGTKS